MDLSVLKGKDPAGYAAEEAFRKRESIQAIQNQLLKISCIEEAGQEGGSPQKYHISGSIAAADSGQFHIYRKKRRAELDRLSKFEQEAAELDADEKHSRHLEELKSKFEEKTEKNRAKRMKKKAKAAQMTKKTPSASTEKS